METITAKQIHAEFMKDVFLNTSLEDTILLKEIGYIHAIPIELQKKFPYRKIIHNNRVIKLCQKYGLIIGGMNRFSDFIPDKNIKELISFEKSFPYYNLFETSTGLFRGEKWHTVVKKTDYEKTRYDHKSFEYHVLAPKEMMVSDKEIDVVSLFKINDPIILASMNTQSGFGEWYIIVTAWGDESDIEEFKNPVNN